MTLLDIFDGLTTAALAEPNVNRVSTCPVTELNTIGTVDYAAVYLQCERVETQASTNTYTINVIYIDRVGDGDNDQIEIESVAIAALNNILNRFNEDGIASVNMPYTITPFYQRYADICAGAWATVNIEAPNYGDCYE